MNFIKITLITFATFFLLNSCADKNVRLSDTIGGEIKDYKLATDFTDEGVKVFYTLGGKLKSIEVSGQAEVWKKNVEAIAEADALAKLTKYIYGTNVSTTRKLEIIGKSMEKFNDNLLKSIYKGDEVPIFTDKQIETEINSKSKSENDEFKNKDLTSYKREAEVLNNTVIDTVTKITSSGKLQGVRKVRDYTKSDNSTYVAVYVWTDKDVDTINYLKQRMQTK